MVISIEEAEYQKLGIRQKLIQDIVEEMKIDRIRTQGALSNFRGDDWMPETVERVVKAIRSVNKKRKQTK